MKQEIAGGLALLAFATLYLIGASGIPQSTLSDEIGARGLPYLLGVLLAIVSVGVIARGVLAPASASGDDNDISSLPRALGVLACAFLYVAVAWAAGYVVAAAISLLAVMLYEGGRPNLQMVAVAILGALFFWLTFVLFLGVEQPVGKLFGA